MKKLQAGALAGPCGGPAVLHIPSISFAAGGRGFSVPQGEYASMERGFKKLSARSLLMAGERDYLVLDKIPDKNYAALLRSCGAGGAGHLVPEFASGRCLSEDALSCGKTLEFIRQWEGPMEFYMPSAADGQLLLRAGWDPAGLPADAALLLNDKVFFVRTMEDLGLPQVETFAGSADAVASRLDKEPGCPVIVRSPASVGGAGAWVASGPAERLALKRRVEKRQGEIFLYQKWTPWIISPNLQFYVGKERICLLGASLQEIKEKVRHMGNSFGAMEDPALEETLLAQGKTIALEAASLGYFGILGIDFIVTEHGEAYAMEINARHNTSTHALWFSNLFLNGDPLAPAPRGHSAYLKWPSARGRLSAMEWMGLLGESAFNPGRDGGVLPYDCGSDWLEAAVIARDPDRLDWLKGEASRIAGGS